MDAVPTEVSLAKVFPFFTIKDSMRMAVTSHTNQNLSKTHISSITSNPWRLLLIFKIWHKNATRKRLRLNSWPSNSYARVREERPILIFA